MHEPGVQPRSTDTQADGEQRAIADAPPGRDAAWDLFEAVADGITVQDSAGRLVFANQAAAGLCGFPTAAAMLAANPVDLVASFELFDLEGRPLDLAALPGRAVLEGDVPGERLVRFRARTPAAAERWAWLASRLFIHADGRRFAVNTFREATPVIETERRLRKQAELTATLSTIGLALSSEHDPDKLVQKITDEATRLTGAAFGAFFYTRVDGNGERYQLYTLSGAPREAFERFGHPRATPLFRPTFVGEPPIRIDDVRRDPRFGQMSPHRGMPPGHLPVVSYLAVPVIDGSGEVLGGLFFGHPEVARFTADHERLVVGLATHAAAALSNARLLQQARMAVQVEEARATLAAEQAARREAQEASRRLQQTLAAISDPFVIYGADWRVLFANDSTAHVLGRSPEELLGKVIWDVVPEARGTKAHQELVRAMETRTPIELEAVDHGGERCYDLRAFPLPDGELAVYARDVTARKREEALRARLSMYMALRAEVATLLGGEREIRPMLQGCCEAVVRHLGLAFVRVWLLDAAGTCLELEASAGRYTHIDGDHARVPVGAFKIGRIAAERKPHLTNDVLHDERVSNKEWARREGMVSFAGYPMIVEGELVGVLAGFGTTPVPDDLLSALSGVSDLIAHGIERRRSELQVREHARDLARSNAELEQFAYVASHDLQEPLRMVASYNQLLARRYKGRLDSDADEFIAFAVEGATRMQRLIQDLLAYSRVGTRGKEFAPVAMEDVLAVATSNLAGAINDEGARITHDPLPTVLGDEGQLTQLLQNLIGNAIKFHGPDAPAVHVSARREGPAWQFSVRDNGVGIEAQYFERIFVIFQRLHTRDKYPGTGIGLAICKKVVERHGGRIWVESAPNQGSTVFFTVPIKPVHARNLV